MSGLQEFKNEKFRGRFLTVTVARENFMDKLKREREESTQSPSNSASVDVSSTPSQLMIKNNIKIIKTFSSDDEDSNKSCSSLSNSTEEREAVVKKKSKLFTENGKVHHKTFCLLIDINIFR